MTKKCTRCKNLKEEKEFGRRNLKLHTWCKLCLKEYKKKYNSENYSKEYQNNYRKTHKKEIQESKKLYAEKNKEKLQEKAKIYRESHKQELKVRKKCYREGNKDKTKEWRNENKEELKIKRKEYRKNNKDKINKYKREYEKKRIEDPAYKMKGNIRSCIRSAFKRRSFKKKSKTIEILGCSFPELREHLIYTFERNYRIPFSCIPFKTLHIDHIWPISLAKTEEDVIKLNHYTNLQYLFGWDNLKKGDTT